MARVTEIFEQFECVSEISSDAVGGLVPLDPTVVAEITEGDDDPRFATFVIDSGWSKSRRWWGPELFQNVCEQINDGDESIVGYMGHIKPEDDGYAFPDIQLQWVKGKVIQAGAVAKLAVKAYVLPGTKARSYMARKNPIVKTVSWRGKATESPYDKGVRVSDFMIESIDLSRPRRAGMSARLVGGLTSEMETEEKDVKPEEIAALQANELRAHNPTLVSEIEKPIQDQVVEAQAAVTTQADILSGIRQALGLAEDADVLDVIKGMASQLQAAAKSVREALLKSVIDKKFKDAGTAKLVQAALVSEMSSLELQGDTDAQTKQVEEMVNGYIDRDDDLKKLVSEMEEIPAAPVTTQNERSGQPLKAGMETSNLRVKAVR